MNDQLHVLITRAQLEAAMRPGDIHWTWCSKHMDRTSHLWDGHKLWCLECHPERKPNAD